MSSRAKAGCTAPRAGARCQQPLRADSPARPAYSTTACSVASSAPAAAAPPPCAPAVAVERLRKARRHTPFARPATVRGRVCGRIGPLVLVSRRCEQVAEYESGPFVLGARATPEPQAVPPELGRLSRQRSSRTGPLLPHAERAALVRRFAAKRWTIGRTIGRRSVAQPPRRHRGQLRRPGAALERPDHATTTITITPVSGRRRLGRRGYFASYDDGARRPGAMPGTPTAAARLGSDAADPPAARRRGWHEHTQS